MTGRRLYEHACDARAKWPHTRYGNSADGKAHQRVPEGPLPAWPFLHYRDQEFWNELARRLTPRKTRGRRKS
jgi:hypothetical protein